MSVGISNVVSIKTQPTAWDMYLASLMIVPHQGWRVFVHVPFPLAGLFLLLTPLLGHRLKLVEIIVAVLAICFTPLIAAIAISLGGRNKLAQGPFTYTFDAEGMRTSGSNFDQLIRWSAIPRIRLSKRFLFVFVGPAVAHCIPLRSLTDLKEIDLVRNIAGDHTDFR